MGLKLQLDNFPFSISAHYVLPGFVQFRLVQFVSCSVVRLEMVRSLLAKINNILTSCGS